MDDSELVRFLRDEIEPLHDHRYGDQYRAAVYLTDETYLPCVVFQSRGRWVDLAIQRFDQVRQQPGEYRAVTSSFVSKRSQVADYQIRKVEPSPFAWPAARLNEIQGETRPGWTAFVVEMDDQARFSYGTPFHREFFDLPAGYSYSNIQKIHNGTIHLDPEGTVPFSLNETERVTWLREKPFFTCYLDGL